MAIRSGLIVTNILWLLDQDLLLQKLMAKIRTYCYKSFMAIRSGLIVTNILWLLDQDLLLQKFVWLLDQDLLLQTFYGY